MFETIRKYLWQTWQARIGSIVVLLFVGCSVVVEATVLLGIPITPYDPLQMNVGLPFSPPSLNHIFGTDSTGRDLFSRILIATPNDVSIGFIVVGVALLVGILVGSVAAFEGGLIDEFLMRFTDLFFALPGVIIAMVIALFLGPGLLHMDIALTIVWWPPYARLARGEALKISHQNYIEAARASGMGTRTIVTRHVIPNIFGTMLVYATLDIGGVILAYAGLSFLGLSIKPPFPDWGEMVAEFQESIIAAPWLPLIPSSIIAIGVLGFSLLGDGIRDAMEVTRRIPKGAARKRDGLRRIMHRLLVGNATSLVKRKQDWETSSV